ncbi:AAA family ATPase [Georgenia thermotolerans]|uniref:AAA family ATPase n=1 Tax=Georgenia thermotolerans TaxID=527326 RepID=UPI001264417D|nr:AAA family ATPase [Georgenia thermotolerans]
MAGLTAHEAEQAVIGALLQAPGKMREVSQIVAPSDFESMPLGELYSLMAGQAATGQPFDSLTLWPAVHAHPILSRTFRSAAQLHDLIEATPTASNVARYAKQVQEAGQSRRLRAAAIRFDQLAGDVSLTAAEKLTLARQELDHIASEYATAVDAPTLAEILAVPDAEIEWVIPGFLAKRDRFVLTGAEGLGKTTLLRQVLICAAAGIHPVTFERMRPLTGVVIDTENSEDQWRWETRRMVAQARRYGAADPGENIRLHCAGRLTITSERDLGMVHSLLDQHQPDLLVIGPLYKLSPGGMNDDKDASPVLTALDSIRDRPDGPAMLMEAHAGHATGGDGERNLRPRGSSMQLGWPEFGLGLAPDKDADPSEGLAVVKRWRGNRIRGRYFPERLRSGGDWPWMEDGAAMNWIDMKSGRAA